MTTVIDVLSPDLTHLDPMRALQAAKQLRDRAHEIWVQAAERVVLKHMPNANRVIPEVFLEFDDNGQEIAFVEGMDIGLFGDETISVPHKNMVSVGEWPDSSYPILTDDQIARYEALEKSVEGRAMSPEDIALAALGEGYGLTLEATRELVEAASCLADLAFDRHDVCHRMTVTAQGISQSADPLAH